MNKNTNAIAHTNTEDPIIFCQVAFHINVIAFGGKVFDLFELRVRSDFRQKLKKIEGFEPWDP